MARMSPRVLPADVLANTLRSTECDVYRRLETVLDDRFAVFYSRPWLGLRPDGAEVDGECDFVVAHPDLGLLALEVKGGAVSHDPADGRWTSRDRWGLTHMIKNPVQQARTSKHDLLSRLKRSSSMAGRWVPARHGVVLPDSRRPPTDLGPDMPRRIFCFAEDFEEDFHGWILSRFGDREGGSVESALGPDGIEALEDILARPFQLHLALGRALRVDENAIQNLTQQQYHILRAIDDVPRAAISGGAGTGKTILALEEARRRASAGLRTLLVCYNRPLAVELVQRLGSATDGLVATFHELCSRLAREAGIPVPGDIASGRLFDEVYPDMMIRALERLPDRRFDAIIVDEGQDFLPWWWAAIDAALREGGGGLLRVFLDSNQRVYGALDQLPRDVQLVPIRLTQNLRNTRRIHEAARRHYRGYEIQALGPEGVAVEWIEAPGLVKIARRIAARVVGLVSDDRVPAGDIAVLAANEKILEAFGPERSVGGQRSVPCDGPERASVVVDTIRRFKGLERAVVVVAVTPEVATEAELAYVALSRARTLLVLVGDGNSLDAVRNPCDP